MAYEAAAPVLPVACAPPVISRDFKVNSYLKVGDFPVLLEVGEAGEIKYGAFSEAGETWALATYGRIIRSRDRRSSTTTSRHSSA